MQTITLASRQSTLALWQTNFVKDKLLDGVVPHVHILTTQTTGDKILDRPLSAIGGKGLFTKEVEHLMLSGQAHAGVHSLKDMPTRSLQGLRLAAVLKREDPRDALVSHRYKSLDDLPCGAIIGTTSARRGMQLKVLRPDLVVQSIRGNVQTRLQKLQDDDLDAIILAYAGLKRLGMLEAVRHIVPIEEAVMIPSMGQGALALECIDDDVLSQKLSTLNHYETFRATAIERTFVHLLNGGCQAPIGVHVSCVGKGRGRIDAIVGMADGSAHVRHGFDFDFDGSGVVEFVAQKMMDCIGQEGLAYIKQSKC